MRKFKKLTMTLALLIAAVTGAWAADVLNIVVSGTSATIMYDGNASNNPYLGDHDWEKSGNPWDMEFTTRSTITTVTIDGSCKNFSGTSLNSLFYMFSGLTTINGLENLNTANVQDIRYMFARCSSLTSLDLSSVKTASVTTMSQMFIGCSKLTSLDLSSWNTENVETTTGLFTDCSELTTVDLSGWNTANVLNTASMFYNCPKLENIYVGDGWSTAAVTNSRLMFTGCTKLPNFDANKVDKTNAHTGEGGYLKVKPAGIDLTPDATRKVWTLDKMPAGNVELQVEYYPESYLFLSKEALADKTSIAVKAGELGVQFGEDGKSANPVTEGTAMTVTYNGTKKILGVKVEKKAVSLIVNPVVGQIIGSDGKNYDANATLPDGVKAVAVIAYVGSETGDDTYKNGLAFALADESGKMNWSTAKSTCEGKTPTVTGAKWCLPSQDQWKQMFKANGGNDKKYSGLNTTITTAGGTTLKEVEFYWSSSEAESGVLAYRVILSEGDVILGNAGEDNDHYVRACLAF